MPALDESLEERMNFISSLYDNYTGNAASLILVSILAEQLEINEINSIIGEKKEVLDILGGVLDAYSKTRDQRYLHAFNEYAIRAKKENEGIMVFPMTDQLYEQFEAFRKDCSTFSDYKFALIDV